MATPRFERQSFFQAQSADTSAARAAEGLAQALGQVSRVAGQVTQGMIDQENAVIKAGVNASAIDAEQIIEKGKGLYGDDVNAFNEFVQTGINGLVSAMDERQVAPFQSKIQSSFKSALTEVELGQHQRFIDEGITASNEVIRESGINAANAARDLNFERVAEQRELLNDSLSPQLFSADEIAKVKADFEREVKEQTVIGMALKKADEEGELEALEGLQNLRETGFEGVSPDEISKAVNQAESVINNRLALESKEEEQDETNTINAQKANAESLLISATGAQGESVEEVVRANREALANREITFKQFEQINEAAQAYAGGIDNPLVIQSIKEDILDNGTEDDIRFRVGQAQNDGDLTPETATELLELAIKRPGLPATPFERTTKQARDFIKTALGGSDPFAMFDEGAAVRKAEAMREYEQRIITAEEEGIDPFTIADDIVKRYRKEPLTEDAFPTPVYGTKEEPDLAIDATIDAFERGEIDEYVRDRELLNLERILQVQEQAVASGVKL